DRRCSVIRQDDQHREDAVRGGIEGETAFARGHALTCEIELEPGRRGGREIAPGSDASRDDVRIRIRAHELGQHVRIEQVAHGISVGVCAGETVAAPRTSLCSISTSALRTATCRGCWPTDRGLRDREGRYSRAIP